MARRGLLTEEVIDMLTEDDCDYHDYYENVDPGSNDDLGFTEENER